jgi:hypothetical protein
MITLQTVPVHCLLHVGTFLKHPCDSRRDDVDRITLDGLHEETQPICDPEDGCSLWKSQGFEVAA